MHGDGGKLWQLKKHYNKLAIKNMMK
jgi:hypothetical protein